MPQPPSPPRCPPAWPCGLTWAWSGGRPRWRRAGRLQAGGGWRRARGGTVSGEAGLGKTTLAAEVARAAFDSGATVLFGHCEEELATPYQLFAEALGHYVTHAPQAELEAHVAAHGSELSRLVPALASRVPGLPPTKATDATPSDSSCSVPWSACSPWSVGPPRRSRARRPPVGRQGQSAAAPAPGLVGHTLRLLVLGTYRDSELPMPTPWWRRWPRSAGRLVCPGSTWSDSTTPASWS